MSEEQNISEENAGGEIIINKKVANEKRLQKEPIEETTTTNHTSNIATSEIKNMEVHHHPHVEKKNFKEYLLEGLMIFLAVTMGFFAENLREYTKDNAEIKSDMQS